MSLRLTAEEFHRLQARVRESKPKPVAPKGRKFHNQPTEVRGMRFDSKAEAERYLVLQDEERRGLIQALQCQVRFDLLPAQEVNGTKERPVQYIADFTYTRNGHQVIEDVKSGPTKTQEFILKRKMLLFFHGLAVTEVMV